MLTVAEALHTISRNTAPLPGETIHFTQSPGRVLAADVVSDVDSPPFDKSMMDGYVLRAADVVSLLDQERPAVLPVAGDLFAGMSADVCLPAGQALRIMTGAPIPQGADCVVRKEAARFDATSGTVQIDIRPRAGDHILRRGVSMRVGESVLPRGTILAAGALGLLAEMGRKDVEVYRRPTLAVLATGDELVDVDQTPDLGQIRNSNEPMLLALGQQCGADVLGLGIARDRDDELDRKIADGLTCDVLCLSGGVSAGERDLVPSALQRAGVEEQFHMVQLKPGKPVWYGVRHHGGHTCHVFGLPGNPVSSLVCFELFVRHALKLMQGATPDWRQPRRVRLASEYAQHGDRPVYHPARLVAGGNASETPSRDEGLPVVELLPWQGSADLRGASTAHGMVPFGAGEGTWAAGQIVPFLEWSHPAGW